MKPLDILYVGTLPPHHGGSGISSGLILSGFVALDHRVRSIAPIRDGAADSYGHRHPELAVSRYTVPYDNISVYIPTPEYYVRREGEQVRSLLSERISERRPDIVFIGRESHAAYVIPLARAHELPTILRITGSQVVGVANGDFSQEYRTIFCDTLNQAGFVCPQAEHMAENLRRLGITNIRTIPNVLDLKKFKPMPPDDEARRELGIVDGHTVILHISNMKKIKRLPDLARSASQVLRENPRVTYIVAGDGPDLEVTRRICEETGVSGSFRFLNWVDYDRVPALLNLADVMILPSEMDHQARVCLETQACGGTVLASDIPGSREIVTDGETGLLFRPGDVDDLATKTLEAVSDSALRTRVGERARKRVKRHELGKVVSQYVAAMYELTDKR